MLILAGTWLAAAATTWTLFVLVCLALEGRVIWSTWLKLWMVLTLLLGPPGTLLAVRFLFSVTRFTLRQRRLERETGEGGVASHLGQGPAHQGIKLS